MKKINNIIITVFIIIISLLYTNKQYEKTVNKDFGNAFLYKAYKNSNTLYISGTSHRIKKNQDYSKKINDLFDKSNIAFFETPDYEKNFILNKGKKVDSKALVKKVTKIWDDTVKKCKKESSEYKESKSISSYNSERLKEISIKRLNHFFNIVIAYILYYAYYQYHDVFTLINYFMVGTNNNKSTDSLFYRKAKKNKKENYALEDNLDQARINYVCKYVTDPLFDFSNINEDAAYNIIDFTELNYSRNIISESIILHINDDVKTAVHLRDINMVNRIDNFLKDTKDKQAFFFTGAYHINIFRKENILSRLQKRGFIVEPVFPEYFDYKKDKEGSYILNNY